MIAVAFEESHRPQVREWLKKHDKDESLADELPEHGFIVEGVCAGFVRRMENSKSCLFDSLITNPERAPVERNQAINLVVPEVISKARELGMKYMHATSVDENTLTRSLQYGFKVLPHKAIALKL